jgi:hypothetical protein
MLAWKLGIMAAASTLLAVTSARADDAPRAIVVTAEVQNEETPRFLAFYGTGTLAVSGMPEKGGQVSVNLGEYWLGLFADPPSAALRSQLKLHENEGLLVESVQPKSPAAKAGIQQYDILLKGNEKTLSDVAGLIQLINQVKDGKLALDLLRAGKHVTLTVTPAKRPAGESMEWTPSLGMGGAGGGWLPTPLPGMPEGRPLEFRFIRPGQIVPGEFKTGPAGGPTTMEIMICTKSKLADGSEVEITRHGAEPAKVVVTRGKEKWEGTSEDLNKIPEKIRSEVKNLVHSKVDLMRVLATTSGPGETGNLAYFGSARAVPGTVAVPGMPYPLMVAPDVEKRLTAMQRQIDELKSSIESLKDKPKKKSAEKAK